MAKGKTQTITAIVNNKSTTTVSKVVELVTVNNALVPDNNDVNPGVNLTTNS
jgi:hypothetical protein